LTINHKNKNRLSLFYFTFDGVNKQERHIAEVERQEMCSLYKATKTMCISPYTLPDKEIEVPVLQPDFPWSQMQCYKTKTLNQKHKVYGRHRGK
jgi:hypothetical protein